MTKNEIILRTIDSVQINNPTIAGIFYKLLEQIQSLETELFNTKTIQDKELKVLQDRIFELELWTEDHLNDYNHRMLYNHDED